MDFNVGDVRTTNNGEDYEILEINSCSVKTGGIVIRFTACGTVRTTDSKSIRNNSLNSKKKTEIKPGDKFNKLTVLSRVSGNGARNTLWLCQCECGNTNTPSTIALTSNHTKSCGCSMGDYISAANSTHGLTGTPEYNIWASMKQRCYDQNQTVYHRYGGRGIGVCDEWINNFPQFLEDMGKRPEGLTLERIDPNKNYSKDNCKWASWHDQAYNTNKFCTNTSGRTGVYWNKKQCVWTAAIGLYNELIHLGTFVTFEDAVAAREAAEIKYYGFNKE